MARGCWAPATSCRGGSRPTVTRTAPDWAERVQVVRSRDLAEGHARTLEQNLAKAEAAALALTPPRGRGRRRFRDEASLQ